VTLGQLLPQKTRFACPAHADDGQGLALDCRQPHVAQGKTWQGCRLCIDDFLMDGLAKLALHARQFNQILSLLKGQF
jgi:hypothetical protein